MVWAAYAIIASVFWALSNVLDKLITEKYSRDPLFLTSFMCLFYLPVLLALPFLVEIEFSLEVVAWSLATAVFMFTSYVFYFKAINLEEISRLIPLYSLSPVLVAVMAAVLLGEILALAQYAGILLVVSGSALLLMNRSFKFRSGKAFWFLMVSIIAYPIYSVMSKHVMSFTSYWTMFFWLTAAFTAYSMIALSQKKKELKKALRGSPRFIGLAVVSSAAGFVAVLSFIYAVSIGPVSLVTSLGEIQSFFVLLIATGLSIVLPGSIPEQVTRKTLAQKTVAVVLMFLGALLVTS
ncbi:MAG: EamA family transporter [Candidatus Diapherotrites archaeon]|nr:EamA family transporter [Candidatus Diapherotrites archaeon]